MRTSWFLVSIAVHGAAITAALGLGVHAHHFSRPPVARIEIRNAPPSAPARAEVRPTPDVELEDELDAQPLLDVKVAPVEPREPEPVIHEGPLPPSASSTLNQATSERVRRKIPEPTEAEVVPEQPAEAPPVEVTEQQESEPAYTSATRSDRGGRPAYPEKERRLGREGSVVVRVSIDAEGSVVDVSLKTPSRYAGFNRAALKAVRRWRFDPATEDGVAVASVTDIEVVFCLTDTEPQRR